MLCRGISVMEDEGVLRDHTSGMSSTDGKWHHIAVRGRRVCFFQCIIVNQSTCLGFLQHTRRTGACS